MVCLILSLLIGECFFFVTDITRIKKIRVLPTGVKQMTIIIAQKLYSDIQIRLQNNPYFCDSPKNACGIQTKSLMQAGYARLARFAFGASRPASCDLDLELGIKPTVLRLL